QPRLGQSVRDRQRGQRCCLGRTEKRGSHRLYAWQQRRAVPATLSLRGRRTPLTLKLFATADLETGFDVAKYTSLGVVFVSLGSRTEDAMMRLGLTLIAYPLQDVAFNYIRDLDQPRCY